MRKKIFATAVVLICLSILATTTLAYFTDKDTARNVITSGGISVEVVEQRLVDGTPAPYTGEPVPIMPGTAVSWIVSVSNLEQAAWIRMSYTVTVLDPQGNEMSVPAEELAKMILIPEDDTAWTEKDGWWYYGQAVDTAGVTAPLFSQVEFSGPDMGNEYQNCAVVIRCDAQAVQQANNGETVLDAAGWPED